MQKRQTMCRARYAGTALAATLLLSLMGCANSIHLPSGKRVSSQDQAGTLEVGVTGRLSPWADVSPSLKPNFTLTGDQARAMVLPVTETINQQVLTALGAGLAIGLPTSSTTGSTALTGASQSATSLANGVTTTTSTNSNGSNSTTTTQKAPGVTPDIPAGIPAGGALPAAVGATSTLGVDPMVQFRAAAELLEEVQLLNQEVAMAATRDCYVAYVARIQLKVINYRPVVPYSVHSKIAFFRNGSLGVTTPADLDPKCSGLDNALPAVVPLLVSDDMQMAVQQRAAEASTQISAALSAMYAGVGAKAQLNAVRQTLNAISNHVTSSTLTIGRTNENTLDAVINPTNLASGEPALAQEPYYVSALVLVPRAYFGGRANPSAVVLNVRSFTQYRDAKTGQILRSRDDRTLAKQASLVLAPYLTPSARKLWQGHASQEADDLRKLMDATEGNELGELDAAAASWTSIAGHPCNSDAQVSCLIVDRHEDLRTTLSSLTDDEPMKVSPVEAPLPTPIAFHAQRVSLNDDGSHPIQAEISNVDAQSVAKLAATLVITPLDVGSVPAVVKDAARIAPTAMTLDTTAHTLTLSFASLKTLGITCLAYNGDPQPAKKGAKPGSCPTRVPVADMAARPNHIEFALIGCNPGAELCPAITDGFSQSPASMSIAIQGTKATLTAALQDLATASGTAFKDNKAVETMRARIESALKAADVQADSLSAQSQVIDVSLVSSSQSTAPSKIALGKTGKVIVITNGIGSFTLVATGIPSGDTAGAMVSGAGIVSVLDGSNQPLSFTKNGFTLPTDGIYQFNLSNMTAGSAIHIAVTDYSAGVAKGDAITTDYTAVQAPAAAKPSS